MIDPAVAHVVAEVVKLGAGLAGIYLTVTLLLAFVQGQIGAATGSPVVMARVFEQGLLIAFCFAVVVTANSLASAAAGMLSAAASADEALAVWKALAQLLVNIVVFSTGAGLTLLVATGAFAGQLATAVGQPGAAATAAVRVGLALVCGALTLLAVTVANTIIAAAMT
jgi:hypothetical protein